MKVEGCGYSRQMRKNKKKRIKNKQKKNKRLKGKPRARG